MPETPFWGFRTCFRDKSSDYFQSQLIGWLLSIFSFGRRHTFLMIFSLHKASFLRAHKYSVTKQKWNSLASFDNFPEILIFPLTAFWSQLIACLCQQCAFISNEITSGKLLWFIFVWRLIFSIAKLSPSSNCTKTFHCGIFHLGISDCLGPSYNISKVFEIW